MYWPPKVSLKLSLSQRPSSFACLTRSVSVIVDAHDDVRAHLSSCRGTARIVRRTDIMDDRQIAAAGPGDLNAGRRAEDRRDASAGARELRIAQTGSRTAVVRPGRARYCTRRSRCPCCPGMPLRPGFSLGSRQAPSASNFRCVGGAPLQIRAELVRLVDLTRRFALKSIGVPNWLKSTTEPLESYLTLRRSSPLNHAA